MRIGQGVPGRGKKRKKRRGGKRRRGGIRPRSAPSQFCICLACGTKVPLRSRVPCYLMICPRCGAAMTKEKKEPEAMPVGDPL